MSDSQKDNQRGTQTIGQSLIICDSHCRIHLSFPCTDSHFFFPESELCRTWPRKECEHFRFSLWGFEKQTGYPHVGLHSDDQKIDSRDHHWYSIQPPRFAVTYLLDHQSGYPIILHLNLTLFRLIDYSHWAPERICDSPQLLFPMHVHRSLRDRSRTTAKWIFAGSPKYRFFLNIYSGPHYFGEHGCCLERFNVTGVCRCQASNIEN